MELGETILDEMDTQSAKLIVQLQLEDATEFNRHARMTDGPTAGGVRDDICSSRAYLGELHYLQRLLRDREIGEQLEDHENELEAELEAAALGFRFDEYSNTVEQMPEPVGRIKCTACMDEYNQHDMTRVPCAHDYCNGCLEELYQQCMVDEALFPPRCCHQEFIYVNVRHALSQRLKSQPGQKRVELETKDRTYCHVSACSAFINPATYLSQGFLARCPLCSAFTCTQCKSAAHGGACADDDETEMVLRTATENGWQRCFGCRRVVELQTGCFHMTCVCRSEFCYICGLQWKTCPCPQWEERRLLERAANVVDREHGHVPAQDAAGRAEMVAQLADHLRENHEYNHERFRSIGRRNTDYECEMCNKVYHDWIYECRQCRIAVCNRCRHNRM